MNQNFRRIIIPVIPFAMVFLVMFTGIVISQAENSDLSKVIFYVGWYDVGKAALEGLEGVTKVDKGFKGLKETNTVHYDSTLITIKDMEGVLKDARTYQGQVK